MYATQLMNVLDMGTLRVSTIQFRESIRFQNLPTDFTLFIEIYALVGILLWRKMQFMSCYFVENCIFLLLEDNEAPANTPVRMRL